ncbi:kelch-like protein 41 [Physella acuta]|uniref:kelch-like protein 41 n=1 Tax=Physella acuta TaxID=109671 RepID=UPI0027DD9F69|nr:kelch-like protein 41 [Physella acuta]
MYQSSISFVGFGTMQSSVNGTQRSRDICEYFRELGIDPTDFLMPEVDMDIARGIFKCFQSNMGNFTDLTVNVGNTKFKCHKFVLGSCSGYFEVFARDKSESSCTVYGILPETFALILDAIYKGTNVLNEGNMLQIWHAADRLGINLLLMVCEKFVKSKITVLNYRDVLTMAKILASSTVMAKIKEVLVKSYFELVCLDDFMKVSQKELMEILRSNQLNVCPDFRVYSVLKWASADYNSAHFTVRIIGSSNEKNFNDAATVWVRRLCLHQLLAIIPLQNISTDCLSQLMNNKYILEDKNAMGIVNGIASRRLDVYAYERNNSQDPGSPGPV